MSGHANWPRGLEPLANDLAAGRWLVIEPPEILKDRFPETAGLASLDYGTWRQLPPARRLDFGELESSGRHPDGILLFQPRSHDRFDWLLEHLARCYPGAELVVAGGNRAGGRVSGGHMQAVASDSRKYSSRGRISLWRGRFDRIPGKRDSWHRYRVGELEIHALPGVFGFNGPDAGTTLLLDSLREQRPDGHVLDYGCGTGIIGLHVSAWSGADATVDYVDTDALALASTRQNLEHHRFGGACQPADGLGEIPGQYDWIISNPPFHHRGEPDLGLVEDLIDHSPDRLAPGGSLVLVANRHLPLEGRLTARFASSGQLAENAAFKVLTAREPKGRRSV